MSVLSELSESQTYICRYHFENILEKVLMKKYQHLLQISKYRYMKCDLIHVDLFIKYTMIKTSSYFSPSRRGLFHQGIRH